MRTRAVAAFAAGTLLLLSAIAHGVLGWPELRTELQSAGAPADLTGSLWAGWIFGSFAMAVFGIIVVDMAIRLWRGTAVALLPVAAIACGYLAFGVAALAYLPPSPPLVSFVIVGLILLAVVAGANKRT
ncbi:MAG: hypothetical protein AB1806_10620 [Acidobacteriota bacterium]